MRRSVESSRSFKSENTGALNPPRFSGYSRACNPRRDG
jgi:hypothetical protein